MKCHLARWAAPHEKLFAPWELIKKTPFWESQDCSSFQSVPARPGVLLELETIDKAAHTMHVEKRISRDGEPTEGPQVMFLPMVKRALPGLTCNLLGQTTIVCTSFHIQYAWVLHVSWTLTVNHFHPSQVSEPLSSV